MTLRFLPTGSFLITIGDLFGVAKFTTRRCVWQVLRALVTVARDFIRFPRRGEVAAVQQGFYRIAGECHNANCIDRYILVIITDYILYILKTHLGLALFIITCVI